MNITDVKVNRHKVGKTVAFAKVVIDDAICIDGIRLIDGQKGLFIGMPNRKDKNDEWRDIVFPINSQARKELTDKIIEMYNKEEDPF